MVRCSTAEIVLTLSDGVGGMGEAKGSPLYSMVVSIPNFCLYNETSGGRSVYRHMVMLRGFHKEGPAVRRAPTVSGVRRSCTYRHLTVRSLGGGESVRPMFANRVNKVKHPGKKNQDSR